MSADIEKYARYIAETQLEEQGPGLESAEGQIQRIQSEVAQELEAKLALYEQGYQVLMDELQQREEQGALAVSSEGLQALEEAEAQLAAEQEPSLPSGQGPGLDGFIEPGKIIFRP